MENHKVNSNEKLLNEAEFMLAVLQTYGDIAYIKEKHRLQTRTKAKKANCLPFKQLTFNKVLEAGLEPAQPSLAKGF